jgi:hypothetical protein
VFQCRQRSSIHYSHSHRWLSWDCGARFVRWQLIQKCATSNDRWEHVLLFGQIVWTYATGCEEQTLQVVELGCSQAQESCSVILDGSRCRSITGYRVRRKKDERSTYTGYNEHRTENSLRIPYQCRQFRPSLKGYWSKYRSGRIDWYPRRSLTEK